MPTTVEGAFRAFRTNLEITGLQASVVSTRQQNVREVIESKLQVLDSFLTGSYARETLISPLTEADVDVFVVLESKLFHAYSGQNGGQAGLLDLVKSTLRTTYTRTPDIARNGQAITIRFSDFVVDVVPGFNRQGGGYLIPNSITQSWISTDPKKHVAISTAANTAHNGDLIPLIKMMKAWNKNIDWYFRSFHLEVLAWSILSGVRISDFPSGVRYFLDKGREFIIQKNPDPAGYGGDVGGYINSGAKIQEAVGHFQLGYERAVKAEDYAQRGLIKEATEMWRSVFGNYFPAYG